MHHSVINLTGKQFGRLKVLELSDVRKGSRGAFWKVICNCGKIKVVRGKNLINGDTNSCGCWSKEQKSQNKLDPKKVAFNRYLDSYKSGAKSRKLEFSLSEEQIWELLRENCLYCGVPPKEVKFVGKAGFLANGLDRLDNCKGYTVENTVPCCKICNSMKSKMSVEEFKQHIERIHMHLTQG